MSLELSLETDILYAIRQNKSLFVIITGQPQTSVFFSSFHQAKAGLKLW